MRRAERDLLRLWEVLVDSTVEYHLADDLDRDELLGPNLRSVQDIEVKVMLAGLGDNLDSKLPLGVCTICDSFLQILAVEVYLLMC